MNIFLDVGGHFGQTLNEIYKSNYRFDLVHCFEPQEECHQKISNRFAKQIESGRLVLHNCGLADFNGKKKLFGGGGTSMGASLFADKHNIDNTEVEICCFVSATDFVKRHIGKNDIAVMKLNCEGGEILILRDLIESGAIHLLNSIFIDFDIRKIPSQRAEEENVIAEMNNCNFRNYALEREVGRVKTFSFSKRKMVSRRLNLITGEGSYQGMMHSRLWWWLTFLPEANQLCNLSVGDRIATRIPNFIYGRILRIVKIFQKITYKSKIK